MLKSRRLHITVALYFAVFHGMVFIFIMLLNISPHIPLMILDAPIMVAWSILEFYDFVEPNQFSQYSLLSFGTILYFNVGYLIGGEIAQKKKLDLDSLKHLFIFMMMLVPILVAGLLFA